MIIDGYVKLECFNFYLLLGWHLPVGAMPLTAR